MARKGEARTNYHVYSQDEVDFLRKCMDEDMNYPQAAAAFNARYGTSITAHTLGEYCRTHGMNTRRASGKPMEFTPDQIAFVKELAHSCTDYDELYAGWCARYGDGRTRRSIVDFMQRHTDIRYGNKPEYTEEQDAWLREHGGKMEIGELVRAFNARFGSNKTDNALVCRMRQALNVDRSHAPIHGKTRFTKEIVEFIDSLPRDMTYADMARQVNAKFGTHTTKQAVSDICIKRLGFKRCGNNGQFIKGQAGVTNLEVGVERNLNGYIFIKIADHKIDGIHTYEKRKVNWMPKHRYIYEQHHGPVPKGWIVIFLDNNSRNFDPENLYAVPRSIHARMCNNGWYTNSREHTLTAIRLCELDRMLRKGEIK